MNPVLIGLENKKTRKDNSFRVLEKIELLIYTLIPQPMALVSERVTCFP